MTPSEYVVTVQVIKVYTLGVEAASEEEAVAKAESMTPDEIDYVGSLALVEIDYAAVLGGNDE